MTHIDCLSPAREWQPPYDVSAPLSAKARAIQEALGAAAADLAIPPDEIVPARLQPLESAYNLDLVRALLASRFEAAQRGRALRILLSASQQDWKRILKQARGAGRILLGKELQ
jgi:uncharacterized protein